MGVMAMPCRSCVRPALGSKPSRLRHPSLTAFVRFDPQYKQQRLPIAAGASSLRTASPNAPRTFSLLERARAFLQRVAKIALGVFVAAVATLACGLAAGPARADVHEPATGGTIGAPDDFIVMADEVPRSEDMGAPKRTSEQIPLADSLESMVPSKKTIPSTQDAHRGVRLNPDLPYVERNMAAWNLPRMQKITYSQFLILLREGGIKSVEFSPDHRVAKVITHDDCASHPGQTHRVGLIYDPYLYRALSAHGVTIVERPTHFFDNLQIAFGHTFVPLFVTLSVAGWALTLGRSVNVEDPLFGGARLQLASDAGVNGSFEDIAGLDDIEDDIMEIVSFLRDKTRYVDLGAVAPAGVLLCGPPGVGKTLLARAIAGEARVPFFSTSGSDFTNMFVGVGALRVRDMFTRARLEAPCILFIDEFDGIGMARSQDAAGGDDSVQTINQLLTEMDGFEDNLGVVVLAATNRPSALDEALTRPGRFDRVISIPYPNLNGRVDILKVHLRGKQVEKSVNIQRIARATAGNSGADLMNICNIAATVAVQEGRAAISENDFFEALEKATQSKLSGLNLDESAEEGAVTPLVRRTIATYVAAKALLGVLTPGYDELQRVVVTPNGAPTGYVYCIPQDASLEMDLVTKSAMEAAVVVLLAGRTAELAVMGADNMTPAGSTDIMHANEIVRTLIFSCGFSPLIGPVGITTENAGMSSADTVGQVGDMSPELAALGLQEIHRILQSAEAKAYFGLVTHWELLAAMVDHLMSNVNHVLTLPELEALMEKHGATPFIDRSTDGFGFDDDCKLFWPQRYDAAVADLSNVPSGRRADCPLVNAAIAAKDPTVHPLNPYEPPGFSPFQGASLQPSDMYFKPQAFIPRAVADEVAAENVPA